MKLLKVDIISAPGLSLTSTPTHEWIIDYFQLQVLIEFYFTIYIYRNAEQEVCIRNMENYKKGKNVEEELTKETIPIEELPDNFLWMHVKGGTKVPNVVEFAEKAFKSGEHKSVVWSGSGGGVPKTISCAEIMKRNFKLHQVTRLAYQT